MKQLERKREENTKPKYQTLIFEFCEICKTKPKPNQKNTKKKKAPEFSIFFFFLEAEKFINK